jgi:hypothetical protein
MAGYWNFELQKLCVRELDEESAFADTVSGIVAGAYLVCASNMPLKTNF